MKVYNRYQMDFNSKWLKRSLLGASFAVILLAVYYLVWPGLQGVGAMELIAFMLLPVLTAAAYIVMARFMRFNAPGMYAILGMVFCLVLLLGSLDDGLIRIVLGIAGYVLGAVLLLSCAGGYLPGRLPVTVYFTIVLVVRVILALFSARGLDWIAEGAAMAMLVCLICLPKAFSPVNKAEPFV